MSYKTKDAEYEAVLRSILTSRSKEGATIDEIRADFHDLINEVPEVFSENFATIKKYLTSMDGIFYAVERNMYLWFCRSPQTRHITAMIEQQKPPRNGGRQHQHHPYQLPPQQQRKPQQQQQIQTTQVPQVTYQRGPVHQFYQQIQQHQQQQQQQQPKPMPIQHYQQQQQQHQPYQPAYATQPYQPQQQPQQYYQQQAYQQQQQYQPQIVYYQQQQQQPQQGHQPKPSSTTVVATASGTAAAATQDQMQRKPFHSSAGSCYFKDNNQFRQKRQYSSEPSLSGRSRSNTSLNSATSSQGQQRYNNLNANHQPAYLYDYQLIGDDFLLALALSDLNATVAYDGRRTKRSGLCISGQTIRDAARNVNQLLNPIDDCVLVNIGSVDLLHGHEFADMKRDFMRLMEAFHSRHIVPVITTLAPLANHCHQPETRRKWSVFNAFLLKSYPVHVLDITPCFRTTTGQTLHDCYQPMAKYVSGSCQPHALWNRLGRQRVLAFLKKQVYETFDVIDR